MATTRSVDTSPWCDPFRRLARHRGDAVEVRVVVQHRQPLDLRDRGEEKVGHGHATMRSGVDKRALDLSRTAFGARGDKYRDEALKEHRLTIMIAEGPRRVPDFERRDDADADQAARDARIEKRFDWGL